jgi:flagellar biosynthetic protein FlhB
MSEEDQDQKTEHPTGKRLGEARDEGRLPVSREVSAWTLFLGILIVVWWLAPPMAEKMITTLRTFIEMPHAIALDDRGLQTIMLQVVIQLAFACGLILLLLAAFAMAGTILQTGLFASTQLIVPDVMRLSPMNGIKRLFSANAAMDLAKSFGKLIVLGYGVYVVLKPLLQQVVTFINHPMMDGIIYLHHQAVHLITIIVVIFAVIAVIDLFYQRFSYIKSLRMTKTEVKDEFKQQEGDPAIKARLRQIRVDKARKRMMSQVPKADVVITNPTHFAVALQYDSVKMVAPIVVAKGMNLIADRIRELATENKVPLVSNPPLARLLYDTVEVDRAIPAQHYRAVAEIISYVYKLKKKF